MISSPSLVDSRSHAEAVKAALVATVGAKVYDYDEVPSMNGNPGVLPNIYVVVSVERRAGAPRRASASTGRTGWRVAARAVGRTVDETRWAMAKVAAALNEARLTIDGTETTPAQFEADQAPELDNGRYSGLALYTYVH